MTHAAGVFREKVTNAEGKKVVRKFFFRQRLNSNRVMSSLDFPSAYHISKRVPVYTLCVGNCLIELNHNTGV